MSRTKQKAIANDRLLLLENLLWSSYILYDASGKRCFGKKTINILMNTSYKVLFSVQSRNPA